MSFSTENTVSTIMAALEKMATQKQVIDVETWMNAAEKINVLLQGEQDQLFELEQAVACMRMFEIDTGKSAAHAKIVVEASDEYKMARQQKALIERAIETIRLAKKHASLSSDLMRTGM